MIMPPKGLYGAELLCRRMPPFWLPWPALLLDLIVRSSRRSTLSSRLNSLLATGVSTILLVGPLLLSASVTTALLAVCAGRVTTLPPIVLLAGSVPLVGVG